MIKFGVNDQRGFVKVFDFIDIAKAFFLFESQGRKIDP